MMWSSIFHLLVLSSFLVLFAQGDLNEQLILYLNFDDSLVDSTGLNTLDVQLPSGTQAVYDSGATSLTGKSWLCNRLPSDSSHYKIRASAKNDDSGLSMIVPGLGNCDEENDIHCSHTVSFWVKTSNVTQAYFANLGISAGSGTLTNQNTDHFTIHDSLLYTGVVSSGAYQTFAIPSTVDLANKWVFIVTTLNHWYNQYLRLNTWIDGKLPGAPVINPPYSTTSATAFLCGMPGYGSWKTQAYFDNFRIHSRALGDSEVFDLLNHDLYCGDGVCDLVYRETPESCPEDCSKYDSKMFLSRDLVIHWTFDNLTSPYTPDISPIGNTGFLSAPSGCSISTSAPISTSFGPCLQMSSPSNLRTYSVQKNFTFNTFGKPKATVREMYIPWTISMWFKVNTLPAVGAFSVLAGFGYPHSNYAGIPYMYLVQTSGGLGKYQMIYYSKFSEVIDNDAYNIVISSWNHLVIKWDGMLKIFHNGLQIWSAQRNPWVLDSTDHNWKFFAVGGFYYSTSYFTGYLDDVRLYKRAISDSEVSILYNCKDEADGCRGPYILDDHVKCGDGKTSKPVEDCDGTLGCDSTTCHCKPGFAPTSDGKCSALYCKAYTTSTDCASATDSLSCSWCSSWNLCASSCITPAISNVKVVVTSDTAIACSYNITALDPDETDQSVVYWKAMGTSSTEVIGAKTRANPTSGEWAYCSVLPKDSRGITGTKVSSTNAAGAGIVRFKYSNKIDDRTANLAPYNQRSFMIASTYQGCSYYGSASRYAVLSFSADQNEKAIELALRLTNSSVGPNICRLYLGIQWDPAASKHKWISTGGDLTSNYDYFWTGGAAPDAAALGKYCVCINSEGLWQAADCASGNAVPLPSLCEQRIAEQDINVIALTSDWSNQRKWSDASGVCNNNLHEPTTTEQYNHISWMLQGSPFNAVWIGLYWNSATTQWTWKSGSTFSVASLPWATSEPKNGTSYPYVAVNTEGKLVTFASSTTLPTLCEVIYATLTAKTAYLYRSVPSSTAAASYTLNMKEIGADPAVISLKTATDIAVIPGRIYALSVKNANVSLTAAPGMTWIKATCDCKNDFANDGKPPISLSQVNDKIKVAWSFNSRCESSAHIFVDGAQTTTVGTDNTCSLTDTEDVSVTKNTGDTTEICVSAYHSTSGYESPNSCSTWTVAWQTTIKGYVKVPTSGTTISYMSGVLFDWWLYDTPEINGTVGPTDKTGVFQISVSTTDPRVSSTTQTVMVRPRYTAFGTVHKFELFGCEGESCIDPNVTKAAPIQTEKFKIKEGIVFIDKSSFILSGTVLINNTRDFNLGSSCSGRNVAMCYVNVGTDRSLKQCINTTDEGKYEIVAAMNTMIEIWPEHSVGTIGSKFLPESMIFNMSVDREATAFYLQPMGRLNIRAAGSKCFYSIGTHNFTLTSRDNFCKYKMTNFIVVGSDYHVLENLPALEYELTYLSAETNAASLYSSAMIQTQMQETYPTDINKVSLVHNIEQSMEFIYHSAGHIQIQSIGDQLAPCSSANGTKYFSVKGSPSILSYNVSIKAWEEYGNEKCGYEGVLWWNDGVSSEALITEMGATSYLKCLSSNPEGTYGCKNNVVSDGKSAYTTVSASILPGEPNVWGTLTYPLTATLVSTGIVTQSTVSVVVIGTIIDENTYASEIPLDVPIMMVFDPPGDGSYAYMSSGKTVTFSSETSMDYSSSSETSVGIEAGIEIGDEVCIGCITTYVCETPVTFSLSAGVTATSASSSGTSRTESKSTSVTIEQTIRTSSTNDLTGPDSDVVVVGVSSIMRAQTKTVRFKTDSCVPELVYGFTFIRTVSGTAVYQIYDIKQVQIPTLKSDLAKLEANPPGPNANTSALVSYHNMRESYSSGITMWEQVLLHHDTILSNSALRKPLGDANSVGCSQKSSSDFSCSGGILTSNTLFFSGGGQEYEFSSSMTSSRTTGQGGFFGMSTSVDVWTEIGGSAFSVTVGESFSQTGVVEKTGSTFAEETRETKTQVGFVLTDSNLGDKFAVRIEASSDYGTPVFFTESGRSKCQWEPNTVPREKAVISISPTRQTDIPAGQPAVFTVRLTNQNEFDEEFPMGLSQVLETNNGGLLIKAFGIQIANTLQLKVLDPYLEFQMEVYRGTFSYDYEGVQLKLSSLCGDDQMDTTATFAVHYLAPCPSVIWTGDFATDDDIKFIVNKKSNSRMRVIVKNPQGPAMKWTDVSSFVDAVLQYREPGSRVWRSAMLNSTNSVVFAEDAAGLAEAWIDVSTWVAEGYYDIRAVSHCIYTGSVVDPSLKTYVSTTISGLVDRTAPEMFGTFAEPADGVWNPGDEISVTFMEDLNCDITDTTFDWGYRVTNTAGGIAFYGNEYLDILCEDNLVRFAFSSITDYSKLIGNKVVMFVKNPSDPAGNVNEIPITWQFSIPSFNSDQLVVRVSGLFLEGYSINEYIALHPNSLTWKEAIIADVLAVDPYANVENMTIQETSTGILLGFDLAPGSGSRNPLDTITKLNEEISNSTNQTILSKASRKQMGLDLIVLYETKQETKSSVLQTEISSSSSYIQQEIVKSSINHNNNDNDPTIISSEKESIPIDEEGNGLSAVAAGIIIAVVCVVVICAAFAALVFGAVFYLRKYSVLKNKDDENETPNVKSDPTPPPPSTPLQQITATTETSEAAVVIGTTAEKSQTSENTTEHKHKKKKHKSAVEEKPAHPEGQVEMNSF